MKFSKEVQLQLIEYSSILLKWNKTINLVSKNTEFDIWNRHIMDCAQLYDYIDPKKNIWDLGSGAGLPGLILSILGAKNITLVESDIRKCVFLRQCANISTNKITIINERIEKINSFHYDDPDIIVTRALCSISDFLKYSRFFPTANDVFLLKGKNYQKELEEASKNWHFNFYSYISKTNPDSVVLKIKNVTAKH